MLARAVVGRSRKLTRTIPMPHDTQCPISSGKSRLKDLEAIDRRKFYGFFDDLLSAIRKLDRVLDTSSSSK